MLKRVRTCLLFLLIFVWATPSPAYAYIDPGSAALLWQIIVSVFIGALFTVRRIREYILDRVKKVWRRKQKHEKPDEKG